MSSKKKLVSMALLGSILIVTALLLVFEPGSPPTSSEPQSGQDLAVQGLQSDQDPEMPAQAEIPPVAEREVLVAPESESATSNISGRILFESRVSIVGAEVVAYRGTPTDKKGGFSNLMGNLAQIGSSNGPTEVFMRVTGEPLARAEVQMDGSFSLEGIRERHVRLAMEHDFYGLKQVEPVHILAGETEVAVGALETYLGAHVIGQVVGPGRGDNAVVHIAAEPDPMAAMRDPDGFLSMIMAVRSLDTPTDGDGRFEFRAMWPSPRVRLMLKSKDHCGRTEVFSLAAGEKRELLLGTQPAISIRAVVVNQDSEPVENAGVSVVPEDIQGDASRRVARSSGRTGEDGTLTLDGLWPGPYQVNVVADGYRAIGREVELRPRGNEPQVIEFALDEGGFVSGVVVNAEGGPVPDARVAHVPSMNFPMLGDLVDMMGKDFYARAALGSPFRTDEEGRFKVTGLQDTGEFHVVAVHDDYVAGDVEGVRMGDEDVTIELQRGARITGTVVADETEEPISNFTVENLVSMMMIMERPTQTETVRDAEGGRFEMTNVVPGRVKLRFRSPGRADATARVQVGAGEEVDIGIVGMEQQAVIKGQVRSAAGSPVVGATVRRKTGGMADNSILASFTGASSVRTDEEGRFLLEGVVPGRLILLAQAKGFASGQSERLRVGAGQTLEEVVIQLGSGGSIAGRLILPAGASSLDWQIIPAQIPNGASGGTSPQADGSFRFDNLDPGRYEVQAFNISLMMNAEGFGAGRFRPGQGMDLSNLFEQINDNIVRVRCVVRADETTEIELDASDLGAPGVSLEVTVRLGEHPMANGWAEINALDGTSTQVGVVDQGSMKLSGLRPGQFRVQVRSGITYTPVGEPRILEIPEGVQTHRVDLDLPGGEIHGQVMDDSTGEALSGTMVRLIHEGTNLDEDDLFGFALTDEEGRFKFLGLAEGTYGLVAGGQFTASEAGAMSSRLQGIELKDSEILEGLLLRARPGAGATVLVTDEAGAPLAGALLLAVDEEGNPLASLGLTFTGPDGRGEFGGLPAGPFRIVGRHTGLAPGATETRQVQAGQHVDLTLRLGRGPHLTLSITDGQGQPLMGAVISARTQDSPWFPATLLVQEKAADGTLVIGPVPAGTWEFRVFHPEIGMFQVTREIPQADRASLILSPK